MKSLILLVLTLCCFITGDKTAPVAMGNTALLDNKYLYVNSSEYGGGFYKDDDVIYYANVYDMRKLYAYDIAKDEAVLLVDDVIRVLYIRVYDDVIYFTGISLSKDYENYGDIIFKVNYSIFKVNKDGSDLEMVIDYAMNPIVMGDYIYYLDCSQEFVYSICRYNTQTKESEVLVDKTEFMPAQLNIVGNKIYYVVNYCTLMEYRMDTKETKLVAHEEYQFERVQYFDGALYYHTGFYNGRSTSIVKKIEPLTYEVETVFDFTELYTHRQDCEMYGIDILSMNITEDKIFFAGTISMSDRSKNESGAFIYDRNEHSLQKLDNTDNRLLALSTYVTDDAIFYMKNKEMDNAKSIVVLDHNGNDISDRYAGMYVGIEE